MKKTIYLLRGSKTETYADFKKRILHLATSFATDPKAHKVRVVLTEKEPPMLSVIPFKKRKIASISIEHSNWKQDIRIENIDGFAGSFEVTEALPVAYTKDWKDGLPTPGVCLLTLFRQKRSIDHDTFIDRWHNSHTPLSLKLHPLWNYNRNVVVGRGPNNLESWDGIVEEHCRTSEDLLNPFRFFGDALHIIPNMLSVYRDTKSFLDYGSIEPYLAMEYHIKS